MLRCLVALATAGAACGDGGDEQSATGVKGGGGGGGEQKDGFRGTITFAHDGPAELFSPSQVADLDLATGGNVLQFQGFDADRAATGETAYITRLGAGIFGDAAVVVADARGVTEPPVYVCPEYHHTLNAVCHTPKLSPDRKLVAFGISAGGGSVCQDNYGVFYGSFVVVRDRKGHEQARFEGYYQPAWLPDGRLLMMGSACRGAGVWIADRTLANLTRVDGEQIGTPAGPPAVSHDGKQLALVWGGQLWRMSLDGKHELSKLTSSQWPIVSAAWSPDDSAFAATLMDVNLPLRLIWIFKPGDEKAQAVRKVDSYPYGPMSWN